MDNEAVVDTDVEAVVDNLQLANEDMPENEDDTDEPGDQDEGAEPKKADPKDEDPWPKKAKNAIARREKQLARARQEVAQLRAELHRFMQTQKAAADAPKAPTEDQFDNYGDFLKAQVDFLTQQKIAELSQKGQQPQMTPEQAQMAAWQEERSVHVGNQAAELVKQVPELAELYQENEDVIAEFPQHIEQMFLEIDNAPAAFLALAKEGKLEMLLRMSPYMAALEIREAQQRGLQYASQKAQPKTTQAPRPMHPAKGSGGASKPLHQLSPDELVDGWLKS